MGTDYEIQQGDCLASIARHSGLLWETIWNRPENSDLRTLRVDPNILFPGDILFIPDKDPQPVSGSTDARHSFRLKLAPASFHVRLLDQDVPRANLPYRLVLEGSVLTGATDGDGGIDVTIPPDTASGTLWVGDDTDPYELDFGHLDPIDEISGVQDRLLNLGFGCAAVTGELDDPTRDALRDFQDKYNLDVTGEPDDATRGKLVEEHGS
jgi:hypothetical protein